MKAFYSGQSVIVSDICERPAGRGRVLFYYPGTDKYRVQYVYPQTGGHELIDLPTKMLSPLKPGR